MAVTQAGEMWLTEVVTRDKNWRTENRDWKSVPGEPKKENKDTDEEEEKGAVRLACTRAVSCYRSQER